MPGVGIEVSPSVDEKDERRDVGKEVSLAWALARTPVGWIVLAAPWRRERCIEGPCE